MSSALAIAAHIQPLPQPFIIDFIGKQSNIAQQFNVMSADLVDSSIAAIWTFQKKLFKDKLVLIGVNTSTTDRYKTPFSTGFIQGEQDTAGVFVHAHILAQYLDSRKFPSASQQTILLYAILIVFIGFISGYLVSNNAYRAMLLIIVPLAIWLFGFYLAMPSQVRVFLPMVSPSLGFIVIYFFASGLQKRKFQAQRNEFYFYRYCRFHHFFRN